MNEFAKVLTVLALLTVAPFQGKASAQQCAANWSTSEYKSFGAVQNEVRQLYGEVRILRVVLCNPAGNPYFQVVIISGQGEVRRVQVAAAN